VRPLSGSLAVPVYRPVVPVGRLEEPFHTHGREMHHRHQALLARFVNASTAPARLMASGACPRASSRRSKRSARSCEVMASRLLSATQTARPVRPAPRRAGRYRAEAGLTGCSGVRCLPRARIAARGESCPRQPQACGRNTSHRPWGRRGRYVRRHLPRRRGGRSCSSG